MIARPATSSGSNCLTFGGSIRDSNSGFCGVARLLDFVLYDIVRLTIEARVLVSCTN